MSGDLTEANDLAARAIFAEGNRAADWDAAPNEVRVVVREAALVPVTAAAPAIEAALRAHLVAQIRGLAKDPFLTALLLQHELAAVLTACVAAIEEDS